MHDTIKTLEEKTNNNIKYSEIVNLTYPHPLLLRILLSLPHNILSLIQTFHYNRPCFNF